jgi:hypothetical protein
MGEFSIMRGLVLGYSQATEATHYTENLTDRVDNFLT